jgi:hypothetical protein
MGRVSRETGIGVAVSALAVGAMAIDHLIGTESEPDDDPGLADPATFLISVALSLTLAALLFGVVVRRGARDDPDRAARKAIACSLLAVPAIALLFLGLPFPLAGAGIALGLLVREGSRKRLATAAVGIGALVIALGAGAYIAALVG